MLDYDLSPHDFTTEAHGGCSFKTVLPMYFCSKMFSYKNKYTWGRNH